MLAGPGPCARVSVCVCVGGRSTGGRDEVWL